MVTSAPGYNNWMGAWTGVTAGAEGIRVGILFAGDNPGTPAVESQYYVDEPPAEAPGILALGPNNGGAIPEQVITVETNCGTRNVYLPAVTPTDCVRTRFYVAADGSTYHSRADHNYLYTAARENLPGAVCFGHGVVGPDLTPAEALVPQHLARAAP
ncbi:MAG: hypothetical protein HY904_02530 [Deltaproteobacteria bacterium]|nr:hypothetical protein [Deltaproteobacteria bacterium]